jgi:uncharacterized MAPEG superfamily protein
MTMNTDLGWLSASVILTWVMLLAASMLRARPWAPGGLGLAFGNRDSLPEPIPMAGRADRAAKNMLENLLLFAVLLLAAHAAGKGAEPRLAAAAQLFFWSRLVYAPLYWFGIAYVRTLAWAGGIVAMAMVLALLL